MNRNVYKRILIMALICSFIMSIPGMGLSYADEEEQQPKATLKILCATNNNRKFTATQHTKLYGADLNGDVITSLDDALFSYSGRYYSDNANNHPKVAAIPKNEGAKVTIFVTSGQRFNEGDDSCYDFLTGEGYNKKTETYHQKKDDEIINMPCYLFYTDQSINDGSSPSGSIAMTFRIEVSEDGVTNNYNFVTSGKTSDTDAALARIKVNAKDIIKNHTDVSDFTPSAKAIVDFAKSKYPSLIDSATTVGEACELANQFNMIVCNAKAIDDETKELQSKLDKAEGALDNIDSAVRESADVAITATRELDMTGFSDEDKKVIADKLEALGDLLDDEDPKASVAEIFAAKEALDKAVIDAKVKALETEKAAVEEDLKEANAALETATEETIPGLQKTIKDLNDKIDQLEKDLKAAKDEYDKAAAENKELLKQIEDLTKAKESAEKQLKAVKDELRNVTNLLVDQSIESALDHAESVINTTVKELSNTSAAIADNALRKVIEAANEAINKATADLSGVLGSNAEAMNKMIERFDGASDRLSKAGERLAEAIATGGTSAREKAELRKQIKEAAAELEKAQKDIETLRADLDKASDGSELQKQIEDLTGELSTAKGELEQTKADLEAAQAALLLATKPAKVDTISVQAGKKKVTVTWSETERAEGFVVYRSLKKKKGYKAVKTIKSGATFKYTDKKVVQGKKYFYKVRAYKMYDGNKLYGAYSAVKKTGKVQ